MTNIPFLRAGDKILNADGSVVEWFRNGWNTLVSRTGDETTDNVANVITGAAQARADAAAAQAAAEAAQQQATDVAAAAGVTFTAAISPFAAVGTRSGSGSATTNSVTATPTGGTGPYLYAWALVSGDTFTVNSATSASTTFTASVGLGEDKTAIYRCTITDSLLATATATVSVTVSEIS